MSVAHRIYEGVEYCSTCYGRLFKPVPCAECSVPVRALKTGTKKVQCRKCKAAIRKCCRCGKAVPQRVGKVVNGEVVCGSCYHYFRTPEPCEWCGQLSTRLSRAPSYGVEQRVCDKCRSRVTHITCCVCGKYRPASGKSIGDKPVCRTCHENPLASHTCPDCGISLPGGGQSRCRPCTNKQRLEREANLQALTLHRDWARSLLHGFSSWLYARMSGSPNLVSKFLFHLPIVQRLDSTFSEAGEISAVRLLDEFGSKLLRKHLLLKEYLEQVLAVELTPMQRADSSSDDLVAQTLRESASQPWGGLLKDYLAALDEGALAPSSRRMYVRTAAALCDAAGLSPRRPLTTSRLARYLQHHPSARTNLARFVRHCSQNWGWDVEMPLRPSSKAISGAGRLLAHFDKLFAAAQEAGLENVTRECLDELLATAFGYNPKQFAKLNWELRIDSNRTTLTCQDVALDVPESLRRYVECWAECRVTA